MTGGEKLVLAGTCGERKLQELLSMQQNSTPRLRVCSTKNAQLPSIGGLLMAADALTTAAFPLKEDELATGAAWTATGGEGFESAQTCSGRPWTSQVGVRPVVEGGGHLIEYAERAQKPCEKNMKSHVSAREAEA